MAVTDFFVPEPICMQMIHTHILDDSYSFLVDSYVENTSWKVLAYGIYARVVDVSEIERVSAANE